MSDPTSPPAVIGSAGLGGDRQSVPDIARTTVLSVQAMFVLLFPARTPRDPAMLADPPLGFEPIPAGAARARMAQLHEIEVALLGVEYLRSRRITRLPVGRVRLPSEPVHSLERFAAWRPTGIALAHYGLLADPADVLEEADGTLRRWAEVAGAAYRNGEDIAAALAVAFEGDMSGAPDDHHHKLDVMNGAHSNAAGLQRWLAKGTASDPEPVA